MAIGCPNANGFIRDNRRIERKEKDSSLATKETFSKKLYESTKRNRLMSQRTAFSIDHRCTDAACWHGGGFGNRFDSSLNANPGSNRLIRSQTVGDGSGDDRLYAMADDAPR